MRGTVFGWLRRWMRRSLQHTLSVRSWTRSSTALTILKTPEELFWGDNPASWLGMEGDKWDLEEVADTDKEGAKAAITPAVEEIICSEPSAQLEGEKMKRLTIGSEQPATLDTPTTSCLATPAGPTLTHSMVPRHKSPSTSMLPQP
jgi:hypothetical protein